MGLGLGFGVDKCHVARLNWCLGGFESGVGFEVAEMTEHGAWLREVRSCDLTREVRRGRSMVARGWVVTWGFLRQQPAPGRMV